MKQIIGNNNKRRKPVDLTGKILEENKAHSKDREEFRKDKNNGWNFKPEAHNPGKYDPVGITNSDYVQIPGIYTVYAIGEKNRGATYERALKVTQGENLMIPNPLQFMEFYNYIVHSYESKKAIFDAGGETISENTKKDLYEQLTDDCWTWLNFKYDGSYPGHVEWLTEYDERMIERRVKLEPFLKHPCFFDPKILTTQGLPKIEHETQEYIPGKNIKWTPPLDGAMATFSAKGKGAGIFFLNPEMVIDDLGVRAICNHYPEGLPF